MRDAFAETCVQTKKLIYPVFVVWGENKKEEVPSMPGVFRYSVDRLGEIADEMLSAGIAGTMLFGIPEEKDALGSGACAEDGVVPRAIRFLRHYCAQKGNVCSSLRTCASANTPRTDIAAFSPGTTWKTTRLCPCM